VAFLSPDEHREFFGNAGYSDIEVIEETGKGWIFRVEEEREHPVPLLREFELGIIIAVSDRRDGWVEKEKNDGADLVMVVADRGFDANPPTGCSSRSEYSIPITWGTAAALPGC